MRDWYISDVDVGVLVIILEFLRSKVWSQVGYDGIGESKSVEYFTNELYCPIWRDFCDWLDFNPLSKLVDCHQYVCKPSWCCGEWSNLVQALAGEWPRRRYGDQVVSRQVILFGEVLTSLASFDKCFCIWQCCRPVESWSEDFTNQGARSCMVSACAFVGFL